jgi:glutamate-ammonia-ligase adenylyltransferase
MYQERARGESGRSIVRAPPHLDRSCGSVPRGASALFLTTVPRLPRPRFTPREIDPEGAERALTLAAHAGLPLTEPGVHDLIARAGAAAPVVLPALLGQKGLAATLALELATRGAIVPAELPAAHAVPDEPPASTKSRLRRMRHEALARTALRELYAHADVDRTAREWSQVAAGCTAHAVAAAAALAEGRHGPPLDERGERVPFTVLGMGKLGGEELNLGSDIDICFFYGTDEGTAGERTLNEHFGRVGALVTELLEESTAESFAFRVDLRLRPEGSRGPMANSLASAERYYETWGRTWERAALVRARPIAGAEAFGEQLLEALRPFVFRRAVDPKVAVEMAQMLERTRREQLEHDTRDLKIGRGGIREAEFFVQSLQLIWGGRHRELQVANTLRAVARLRALGLLSHREAQSFGDAWALLRRVEHRVQVMFAYATHLLPDDAVRQQSLARSLGYPSFEALATAVASARETIRSLFATLFPRAEGPARPPSVVPMAPEAALADLVASGASRESIAACARDALGVRDPDGAVDQLLRLARRVDLPLGAIARDRDPQLGPRLLAEVRDAPDPDRALAFLADLFNRLHGAAERYARRLAEAPEKARGLVGLFGASETLSKTLVARPDLVDAVVAGGAGAPTRDEIPALVSAAVAQAARASAEEDPIELTIGALRRVQRETVLAVGLADMAGELTAGEVARRLSRLAQAVLAEAFALAAREAAERYGLRAGARDPLEGVAVFALGSLAAQEMGYGGDLDVIVLYDREGETCGGRRAGVSMAEYVVRLTQRAIAFLSSPHAEGPGYAVDTQLRPSGSQGTLVVSLESFVRYHAHAGGEARAASWERQALIRSRFVAGDEAFGESAAAQIESIAYARGPADTNEMVRLRARMERELGAESRGEVALKYGRGALVDVEFAAQALQMAHGDDARVHTPSTRRALVALREAGVLDPVRAEALLSGEKLLRRALLATRLVSERSVLVPGTAAATTVARKLGYRERGDRTPEGGLLADLAHARERVRQAFDAVMADLGANGAR